MFRFNKRANNTLNLSKKMITNIIYLKKSYLFNLKKVCYLTVNVFISHAHNDFCEALTALALKNCTLQHHESSQYHKWIVKVA